MSVYEFGDLRPVVKVCLDEEGWEWFRDLVTTALSPNDGFRKDVEAAEGYLALLRASDDE